MGAITRKENLWKLALTFTNAGIKKWKIMITSHFEFFFLIHLMVFGILINNYICNVCMLILIQLNNYLCTKKNEQMIKM